MPKERERVFQSLHRIFARSEIGLKCSYFDGLLKYLLYNSSKLHVHLLHHKSFPKISLNSFNLILMIKQKVRSPMRN